MSSMSTPVANLPKVDNTNPSSVNTDPVVTDVLEEMEREVAAAKHSASPIQKQSMPQQAQPYMYNGQQMMPQMQQMPQMPSMYMKDMGAPWIDKERLQTAVVASVIAMLLLLPKLPNIYDRFSRIAFLEPYETYIRVALLALVLYLVMIKLNI